MTAIIEKPDMLDQPWVLSPRVALRPEPFGALAYHFGNRRLSFLKRRDLVDVVEALGESGSIREAFESQHIETAKWPAYLSALDGLAKADMICPRTTD
ncbi:MAG: mycofactocin biosynthesis chaperone MftB [Aeromicrobium sp.]